MEIFEFQIKNNFEQLKMNLNSCLAAEPQYCWLCVFLPFIRFWKIFLLPFPLLVVTFDTRRRLREMIYKYLNIIILW